MLSVFHWFHTAVLFKVKKSWYIQKMFWYCPSLKKGNFGNGSTVQTPCAWETHPFGKGSDQILLARNLSASYPFGKGSVFECLLDQEVPHSLPQAPICFLWPGVVLPLGHDWPGFHAQQLAFFADGCVVIKDMASPHLLAPDPFALWATAGPGHTCEVELDIPFSLAKINRKSKRFQLLFCITFGHLRCSTFLWKWGVKLNANLFWQEVAHGSPFCQWVQGSASSSASVPKPGLVSCKCKSIKYFCVSFWQTLVAAFPKLTECPTTLIWPTKSSALKLWCILKLRFCAFLMRWWAVWNLCNVEQLCVLWQGQRTFWQGLVQGQTLKGLGNQQWHQSVVKFGWMPLSSPAWCGEWGCLQEGFPSPPPPGMARNVLLLQPWPPGMGMPCVASVCL